MSAYYLPRLLSMGHENIFSTPMMQESLSFLFRRESFRKKKHTDFMCYRHRVFTDEAICNNGFDKLLKLKTFQNQRFSCSLI